MREEAIPGPVGTWREVGWLFLRMGATAFGGPAAHVALMEDECVRARRWVTPGEFADVLGAANLLPGPSSTELAMMLGLRRAGWAGLLAAGTAFIGPAVLLVWLLAWAYVRYGTRPEVALVLAGLQPVVLAVVVQAVWRLARSVLRTGTMRLWSVASLAAALAGMHELVVLLTMSVIAVVWREGAGSSSRAIGIASLGAAWNGVRSRPHSAAAAASIASTMGASLVSTSGIFGTFFKLGCVIFGSGYVIVAFMRAEFVQRNAWISETQLLDAIAIGQITPGPVFSTATFIGYLLAGHAGAWAATAGMFLPSFALSAVSGPLVARLRQSVRAAAALDGLNAASLALMAAVAIFMARGIVPTVSGALLSLAALALLLSGRVGTGWLLVGGMLVSMLRAFAATLR